MLFDKNGRPTHLFNSADPGNVMKGWKESRAFTMVTEILKSSQIIKTDDSTTWEQHFTSPSTHRTFTSNHKNLRSHFVF